MLDTVLTQDLPTFPLFQEPVSLIRQSDIVKREREPRSSRPAMERRRLVSSRRLPRPLAVKVRRPEWSPASAVWLPTRVFGVQYEAPPGLV